MAFLVLLGGSRMKNQPRVQELLAHFWERETEKFLFWVHQHMEVGTARVSGHPLLCLSHQPCSQPVAKTRHERDLITLAHGSQEIINSFMEVTSLGTIKSGRKGAIWCL